MPIHTILKSSALAAVTLALALALASTAALAQQRPAAPHAAPPTAQAAHFSDQQLQSFAHAALQVRQIAQKAEVSLKQAKTNKAKQTVLTGAEKQQIQALKTNGLTVGQYNAISTAARHNPKMRLKIGNYVKQDIGKGK